MDILILFSCIGRWKIFYICPAIYLYPKNLPEIAFSLKPPSFTDHVFTFHGTTIKNFFMEHIWILDLLLYFHISVLTPYFVSESIPTSSISWYLRQDLSVACPSSIWHALLYMIIHLVAMENGIVVFWISGWE